MIRPLRVDDVVEVATLDAALFAEHAWSVAAWRQEAATDHADKRYLVLDEAAVVGYAGILRSGSDADVLTVAVAAEQQRKGFGRMLMEGLLQVAQQWRCQAVFLEVSQDNTAARRLYERLGFTEMGVRRHYYGPDRHAVTMRLQLREPMGSLPMGGQG